MATYYVTKVRKENSTKGTAHEHIVGVITKAGKYHKNKEVVDSLGDGDEWYTEVTGEPHAKIKEWPQCTFVSGCSHEPYLTTDSDSTKKNNLENLPRG